jgi:multisubunit Na+/H+ antiporter MnhF subunit
MWSTHTYWFDVALVMTIFAFGGLLFGRFEEHRSRWRRAAKIVVVLALFLGVSAAAGRAWMYALLALAFVGVVIVHGWWLPKHGVNGWTAEPRERYYALLGLGPDGRPLR